mgnify:FL=1|tara:strand:+ start:225 stop:830 length:606 start_codon:yes stop_codon:yes gene_type:complete
MILSDKKILQKQNRLILSTLFFIFIIMLSLSYASVPLYDLFCKVTGFGGTTQVAEKSPESNIFDNSINIRFDSNVSKDLDWSFSPEIKVLSMAIGKESKILYHAKNLGDIPVVGTATFNVTPAKAGKYFMKIDCFCFEEQLLMPGDSIKMPVTFFIDPDILLDENANEINEITLSYTFMRSMDQKKANQVKESYANKGNKT